MSSRANNYFEGYVNHKFTPERDFNFSKKENEGILRVVERRGWQQWVAHPQAEVSKILIMEFYANLMGAYYLNHRAKFCFARQRTVHYDDTIINNLLNINPLIGGSFKEASLEQQAQIVYGHPVN